MPKSRPRTIPKLDFARLHKASQGFTVKPEANIKGRIFRAEEMSSFFESSDPNEMYLTLKEEIEEEIRKKSKLWRHWMKTEWVTPP